MPQVRGVKAVVERRRAHAIEIMLSRFSKSQPLEAVAKSVHELDFAALSLDDVCALLRCDLRTLSLSHTHTYTHTNSTWRR